MINFTRLAYEGIDRRLSETIGLGGENVEVISTLRNMVMISFTKFSQSSSLYFSLNHVLYSSLIGLSVLDAMRCQTGNIRPTQIVNLMASILFCNVGVIKGILADDIDSALKVSTSEFKNILPAYTDSYMWKYKAYRSKKFIEESSYIFSNTNQEIVSRAIDYSDISLSVEKNSDIGEIAKCVRAIQIISLMSDENFERRQVEYYLSAKEGGGLDEKLFPTLREFKEKLPQYFWERLYPDVGDVILLLRETIEGRNIVSQIYTHL